MIGQFKLLRADSYSQLSKHSNYLSTLTDNFSSFSVAQAKEKAEFEARLFHTLDTFAEMLSKSATEQIIEALKNVIQDFNKNLTEQFGENFKALDASVKKLVAWQQQYKEQIEVMGEQYEQSVTSLVSTRESVAGIWQECENIPKTMHELKDVLEVNQHQITELERHLEVFVSMRDAAVEAVPTIQKKVEEVAEGLSNSGQVLQENLVSMSQNLKDTNEAIGQSTTSMQKEALQAVRDLEDGTKGVTQSVSELLRHFDSRMEQMVADTGKGVNAQLNLLEQATAREIQAAIEELGKSLVHITRRFVDDYQVMVTAMDKVVGQHKR